MITPHTQPIDMEIVMAMRRWMVGFGALSMVISPRTDIHYELPDRFVNKLQNTISNEWNEVHEMSKKAECIACATHDLITQPPVALSTRYQRRDVDVSLLVSQETPFRILEASPPFLILFGFRIRDILKASLRLLCGPLTDFKKLQCIVASALRWKSAQDSIVLYQNNGDDVPCRINAFDSSTCDGSTACALVITRHTIEAHPQSTTANIPKQPSSYLDTPRSNKALFEMYHEEEKPAVDPVVLIHIKAVRLAVRSGGTE